MCKPNIAVYLWGNDQQKMDKGIYGYGSVEEVAMTLEQSAWPCEKKEWLWWFCVDREGESSKAAVSDAVVTPSFPLGFIYFVGL